MSILIAMDEYGEFNKDTDGIRFVGGCKKTITEYEYEKERVSHFFMRLCADYNNELIENGVNYRVVYPYSIHTSNIVFFQPLDTTASDSDNTGDGKKGKEGAIRTIIDGIEYISITGRPESLKMYVNAFRKKLRDETTRFLKDNDYKLFAFLQGEEPGAKYSGSNITNLNIGINLYERLAVLSIINNIYYTLDPAENKYYLEIAQMTAPGDKDYSDLFSVNDRNRVVVTRTSTYKTALSTFLYDREGIAGLSDTDYRLNVAESNYFFADVEPTPFLYLADIACMIISGRMYQRFEADSRKNKEAVSGKGLFEISKQSGILFRVYGQVEVLYRNMIESIRMGDVDNFYGDVYDMEHTYDEHGYSRLYLDFWVKECENFMVSKIKRDKEYCDTFSMKIPEMIEHIGYLMSHKNIKYEKGLYVAEKICELVQQHTESNQKNRYLFVLYDMIMQGHNHRGSVDESRRIMAICENYKEGVTCEEYLDHVNKALNIHINNFEFDDALKKAHKLVGAVNQLKNTYVYIRKGVGAVGKELAEKEIDEAAEKEKLTLAGEIYSSIGQIYAFKGDNSQAIIYFKKALKEFANGDYNYNMTMSFYLLLLSDIGNKEEYELMSRGYFETSDLSTQLDKAINSGNPFMLSLFVKAYKMFYNSPANVGILKRLVEYVKIHNKPYEHPWELIYKNLYESMYRYKESFIESEIKDIRKRSVSSEQVFDTTILIIQTNSILEFMELEGEISDKEANIIVPQRNLEMCVNVFGVNPKVSIKELREILLDKIVFSYR